MAFIDAPDFDSNTGQRDGTIPRFFMEARPNNARSAKEGRPCFDDVEMVEINIPGDRLSGQVVQIVKDDHKQRWPKAYAAFKANQEAPAEGTPIDQLPGITKAQVEELRFFRIHTVEAMANLSDQQLSKVVPMYGLALRDKAKRWVAQTEGAAAEEKLAAENRELRVKMDLMEKDQAEMRNIVAGLQAQLAAANGAGMAAPQPSVETGAL